MYPPRICSNCKKPMVPLVPASLPKAGEWRCEPCDKSELMTDPAEYNTYNQMLNQK